MSEAPGSIVYYLVTLLTLQVVIAISRSQWRRDDGDSMAIRATWAASLIFLARVAFLLTGVLLADDAQRSVSILPNVEQAIHAATAILVAWALVYHPRRLPRLGDTLLIVALLVTAAMTLSYGQQWRGLAQSGIAFLSSPQASAWRIVQVSVLAVGFILTLVARQTRHSLNPVILGTLLVAHAASLGPLPDSANVDYWVRLGHLVAFPLWAAAAYRQSLSPLLASRQSTSPSLEQLKRSLHLSAQLMTAGGIQDATNKAVHAVSELVNAVFVGIAILVQENTGTILLHSNMPRTDEDRPRSWEINLSEWPAFRLAIEQNQSVQLLPNGLGARQLYDWYKAMGIGPMGALLIHPVANAEDAIIALLVLAASEGKNQWTAGDRALVKTLSDYLGLVFSNYRRSESQRPAVARSSVSEPESAVSGRMIALEEDRKRLLAELDTIKTRLQRSEEQAATSSRRARDLADTLEELESLNREQKIAELQSEIDALRESLIEAEEAMAMAAAGEKGLSTEWMMLTITRYSGQLEEAQARIQALEREMERREKGPANAVVASLAQDLRTPMTSIGGFTDLLLSEKPGALEAQQRDFLHKIKANSERMGSLLEHIVQLTTVRDQPEVPTSTAELVNLRQAIDTAIDSVASQIRKKMLYLDLDVSDDLPALPIDRNTLSQILTSLLDNACQSTPINGRIALSAHSHSMPGPSSNGQQEIFDYVKLTVTDGGGGIAADDRARVFDPQFRADNPLIEGLGDTGAALSVARALTESSGGRIWVDSELGLGSSFSTLFPVVAPDLEPLVVSTQPAEGFDDGTH